jgi:hypothetical protein
MRSIEVVCIYIIYITWSSNEYSLGPLISIINLYEGISMKGIYFVSIKCIIICKKQWIMIVASEGGA